jgi:arsenate reductase (thioredoxin)
LLRGVKGEPMRDRAFNVLFLCTHNSARSILAEEILNRLGEGRFHGYSAGSHPSGRVNPLAIELLRELGHPVEALCSKDWDDFAEGPEMDFVITVCDQAAGEVCPIWPGKPTTAHWGIPDPAAAGSSAEIACAFAEAAQLLRNRISLFRELPLDKLNQLSLQDRIREIGAGADQPAA